MTEYRRTERFERIEITQDALPEWSIEASAERPYTGWVALRSIGEMPRVVFIGSAEQADIEFEEAD